MNAATEQSALPGQDQPRKPSINRCPPELLEFIFISASDEDYIPVHYAIVARLRLVCSHWNALVLACPALWSSLDPNISPDTLQAAIFRSKDHPLTVMCTQYNSRWGLTSIRPFLQLMMQHVSRWKRATLWPRDPTTLDEILSIDGPILETLHVSGEFLPSLNDPRIFRGTCPQLLDLTLDAIEPPWNSDLIYRLRSLRCSFARDDAVPSVTDILDLLSKNPNMETLALSKSIQVYGFGDDRCAGVTIRTRTPKIRYITIETLAARDAYTFIQSFSQCDLQQLTLDYVLSPHDTLDAHERLFRTVVLPKLPPYRILHFNLHDSQFDISAQAAYGLQLLSLVRIRGMDGTIGLQWVVNALKTNLIPEPLGSRISVYDGTGISDETWRLLRGLPHVKGILSTTREDAEAFCQRIGPMAESPFPELEDIIFYGVDVCIEEVLQMLEHRYEKTVTSVRPLKRLCLTDMALDKSTLNRMEAILGTGVVEWKEE